MTYMRSKRRQFQIIGWTCAASLGALACGTADPDVEQAAGATEDLTFKTKGGVMQQAVFDTPDGPRDLTYELVGGQRLLEGDIVLGADQPDFRSGVIASTFGKVWPNGIVPYESTGLANDSRVVAAIRLIEERTVLRFIPGATTGNRVRFVAWNNPWCSSSLGMQGGRQDINVFSGCTTSTIVHEIGHAVGVYHEQSRTDRDSFVNINWNCIQSGAASNFEGYGFSGADLGPYDITSIMQYPSFAFLDTTVPGCSSTIVAKNGSTIPLNNTLTGFDVAGINSLYRQWHAKRMVVDYDGDRKADIAVYQPTINAGFTYRRSSDQSPRTIRWGCAGCFPVPGDYDGDALGDIATWHNGAWSIQHSSTRSRVGKNLGQRGDVPVHGDWDGDRKTDVAVYRPFTGVWYITDSSTGSTRSTGQWGLSDDIPVPADYDGDGKMDFALWRPSNGTWYIVNSSTNGFWSRGWGLPGDVPVPADYDRDGKMDTAVWRPSNGTWYIIRSSTGASVVTQWGLEGDMPVPADYDGDRFADLAVWRPTNGTWYFILSSTGQSSQTSGGSPGDVPVP